MLSWEAMAASPDWSQTDQAALGLLFCRQQSPTCGFKTQTIFCLLAQPSMTLWMEKISVLQLVLLLGFSSHRWRRVGADVGMGNEPSDGLIWTPLASSVYFLQLIHKPRESNSKDFARTLKHQIYVSTPASNRAQPLPHLCTAQPCRKRQMCFSEALQCG